MGDTDGNKDPETGRTGFTMDLSTYGAAYKLIGVTAGSHVQNYLPMGGYYGKRVLVCFGKERLGLGYVSFKTLQQIASLEVSYEARFQPVVTVMIDWNSGQFHEFSVN